MNEIQRRWTGETQCLNNVQRLHFPSQRSNIRWQQREKQERSSVSQHGGSTERLVVRTSHFATERLGRSFVIGSKWTKRLWDDRRPRTVPRSKRLVCRGLAQYRSMHVRIQGAEAQRIDGKKQHHPPTQALLLFSFAGTAASHMTTFRFVFRAILMPAWLLTQLPLSA